MEAAKDQEGLAMRKNGLTQHLSDSLGKIALKSIGSYYLSRIFYYFPTI
jgi:hypothetical protein